MIQIILNHHPQATDLVIEQAVASVLRSRGYEVVLKPGWDTLDYPRISGAKNGEEHTAALLAVNAAVCIACYENQWESDFLEELDCGTDRLREARLEPIGLAIAEPISRHYPAKNARVRARDPKDWQRLLLWAAAGGVATGVRRALDGGADPAKGTLRWDWDEVRESEPVYRWAIRSDARRDNPANAVIKLPIEAAVAGGNADCVELIARSLPAEQIRQTVQWLLAMQPKTKTTNLWRERAKIALAEGLWPRRAEFQNEAKALLEAAGKWARKQPYIETTMGLAMGERREIVLADMHRRLSVNTWGVAYTPPMGYTLRQL